MVGNDVEAAIVFTREVLRGEEGNLAHVGASRTTRIYGLNPQTRLAPKESFARFTWTHVPSRIARKSLLWPSQSMTRTGNEPSDGLDSLGKPELYYLR